MKANTVLVTLFLLGQLWLAGGASAVPRDLPAVTPGGAVIAPAGEPASRYAREGISLDEAVKRVRQQTGGRVIKASERTSNGRTVYHIRVLTADGRVFTVRVDAATGRTL